MTFSVASSSVSIVPFVVNTVVRRRDLIFSSDVNSFFAHDMHGHSRIHNNVSKMILKVKVSSIPMLVRPLGRNVPRNLSNSFNHVHASCRVQSSAIGVKFSFRSSDVRAHGLRWRGSRPWIIRKSSPFFSELHKSSAVVTTAV